MGPGRPRQQSESALVHQPFRVLGKLQIKPPVAEAAPAAPAAPPPPPSDAASLFHKAVADVTPLGARERARVAGPAPASPARALTHPDAEALAELCEIVGGIAPFDISDSDEHIEGAMAGLDPRLLRRLRSGEFAYQDHLDLHGMTSEEARPAVESFLTHAYQGGKRCVLIVHGRGRNSKDQIPVLKSRLATWLARGQSARRILAFASARPCDGGAGALYVLLRRQRNVRRPIRVITGAKW
ncbi:MAG: Smr/MutS family protein [Candidatus Binatia bacterium]